MAAKRQAAKRPAGKALGKEPAKAPVPEPAPILPDAAIRAKTGKGWEAWYAALDQAGAASLDHKAIASLARDALGAGRWYGQMIAVSYERARGIRAANQKCNGEFSVSVSKTLACGVSALFAAAADEAARKHWFPKGGFRVSSETEDKYLRGAWGTDGARLEINFYAKGADKAQINIQVNKLPNAAAVEPARAVWKSAAEALAKIVTA